jgi:hypothetical protein
MKMPRKLIVVSPELIHARDRMIAVKVLIPILALALPIPSLAAHRASAACLTFKRAVGAVFCSGKDASFLLTGRTTGARYSIYDYRYRFLSHPEGVMHGGQRLVVFRGKRYIGQYALTVPPMIAVSVSGTRVVLSSADGGAKVRLDFSRKPPERILVAGEVENFFR